MINITDNFTFDFSRIENMGYGIQVSNKERKKILLNMCHEINDIIVETVLKLKGKE